jgi:glutaminyl-tRNA synthetase
MLPFLEFCLREHLNKIAWRRMVVLDPLKVVITNFNGETEYLPAENLPGEESSLHRTISFSREIYIEREDFMENPPSGYNRLSTGGMVRLKHAFIIKCDEAVKNADGSVKELHCSYISSSP